MFLLPALAVAETWQPAQFFCLLNTDYSHRPLEGWKNTGEVIGKTLEAWYPELKKTSPCNNPSQENAQRFFNDIVATTENAQIIYLASRQTKNGEWEDVKGGEWSLESVLPKNTSPHAARIVLLDACYAEKIAEQNKWREFAPLVLYAANKNQLTFELNVGSRQPIDIQKRYPQSYQWLEKNMPSDWNQRISFFGLMWLEAWLKTPTPPQSKEDWRAFFETAKQVSQEFAEHHPRLASELIFD